MNVQSPPRFEGSIADAFELAKRELEPVFVPAVHFADDRGWSLMNQLQGVMSSEGQVNFSVQYPGVVKAWHRHTKQTDFWMCLLGHIKVGVHDQDSGRAWSIVIGEKRPGIVVIPPPLWHGAATVGDSQAGLLYYVTHAYDPATPDEERTAPDAFAGFPWQVEHK
ncbi:MAG: dTDP-4-dehydrorhamnose 3,5-epimerase [Phycisphaerales bacterium]